MDTTSGQPEPPAEHRGYRLIGMDQPSDVDLPVNMILWGKTGCGKTSLASSAPGNKLFIQFDRSGHTSLAGRADCTILDVSSADASICDDFVGDNPLLLRKVITDRSITTIVFDSLTTYYWVCLNNVISKLRGRGGNSISLETPSQAGYGQRNIVMLRSLTAVMLLADKLNLGVVFILHENTQQMLSVKQGDKIVEIPGDITPSITTRMVDQIGVRMSEIWHMTQLDGGSRRVELRPGRHYTPMKSRMFDTTRGDGEFTVKYDATTNKGDGIATWIDAWRKEGGRKIALPK